MARSKQSSVASRQSPDLEMSDASYELPNGWTWKNLVDVVAIGSEQVIPQKTPRKDFNYVALENVEQGTGQLVDFKPTRGEEIKSNKYTFTPKHILYGKLRPYLRKVLAPDFDGVSATDLLPLLPQEDLLERRFLMWWLLSSDVLEYVVGKQTGVKMPRLRTGDLHRLPVPLPPLPEQQRIVARIESLFAESRTARDALERVPALLKRFRQSILASAFRGELTEHDPNDESASALLARLGKTDAEIDASDLPEGWCWVRTEMLAADEPHSFTDGPFGSNLKTADYTSKGVRVIRLQNLGVAEFKNDAKAFVSREKYESLRKHEAKAGDVIIAALAEPVGRACLVPEGIGTAIVKADCIRLHVDKNLADNKYVMLALNTQEHFKRAEDAAHGVGRLRANFSDIKSFVVPLAPPAEQRRIVAQIESLFAQADAIERAIAIAQKRADKIDQSILVRAFRGDL